MPLVQIGQAGRRRFTRLAFCVFLAVAAFYLVTEHSAHLMGWLPYMIFLLCPIMHVLMHRSHPHGKTGSSSEAGAREHSHSSHEHH